MPPPESMPAPDPAGIQLVNPLTAADWDQQVASLPGAGFFHTAAWARVLANTYGYQPLYLGLTGASGRWRGLLPLMEVTSWLTGRRGVSLPFTDEVAPLCPDAGTFEELFHAAQQLGRERRWRTLEIRGGLAWRPDAPAATSFFNHSLPLGGGEAALFAGCTDAVRRAIRKAEKNHLSVEFSQSEASMQAFYQLLGQTRRRHGVPPQPYAFFQQIQQQVMTARHGWIVLARHDGRPVAGAVFFHGHGRALYKFGASDETRQELRANNLVMWRAIQHYAREDCTRLDFGRTSLPNAGLRQFKLGWGTQEETLGYLRFDLQRSCFVTARDDAQGWHNRVFRALPLSVSRLAGRLLYRHMG